MQAVKAVMFAAKKEVYLIYGINRFEKNGLMSQNCVLFTYRRKANMSVHCAHKKRTFLYYLSCIFLPYILLFSGKNAKINMVYNYFNFFQIRNKSERKHK